MAIATRTARALLACHLAAFFLALAGCSQFGKPEEKPEPNIYPANYKTDLLAYLRGNSNVLVNASATYVSAPALKQFGSESRYFVCLRIDGQNARKEKFVLFYAGLINQFVDATSEQCGAAAYQPFPEALAAVNPPSGKE
jgi:hypothetical protein